jgi:hypothetical protein
MRKSVFVLAVIGAACSGVAFAGEVKKDGADAPTVKATTMSDADMDKVTAGAGFGLLTASSNNGGFANGSPHLGALDHPPAGLGNCTAAAHGGNAPGGSLC